AATARTRVVTIPRRSHFIVLGDTVLMGTVLMGMAPPRQKGRRLDAGRGRAVPLRAREVLELRVLAEECQVDRVGRAVAVLLDDDLRFALFLRLLVVVVLAVDEHHHVCILLERTGLTEVGKTWPPRLPRATLLRLARELRYRDDRNLELLREDLQRARDIGDLLDAVLGATSGLHQLDVIDHYETERALLRFQASTFRADLAHRDRRRVVDVHRRFGEAPDRLAHATPLRLLHLTAPDLA